MTEKIANINVYAAGGAGINITKYFETYRGRSEPGLTGVNPIYLDTSRSNLVDSLPDDNIYTIEGLDGSGKVRKENVEKIAEHVLDILLKHPANDLNIVISSGGGGSGSVIAPSLVSELLSRDVPVIVIMIGSTDSKIELVNTIRTIKSYESVAQMCKVPVVSMYFENSISTPRKSVDADIHKAITLLGALFSGKNREMDSSDLRNWLKYTKVTSYEPRLSNMEFFLGQVKLGKGESAISVATLATDDGSTSAGIPVDYQTVGHIDPKVMSNISDSSPIHAVVIDGVFNNIHSRLDADLRVLEEAKSARISKSSILTDSDKPTTRGIVV